jgi:hypothetical protein
VRELDEELTREAEQRVDQQPEEVKPLEKEKEETAIADSAQTPEAIEGENSSGTLPQA